MDEKSTLEHLWSLAMPRQNRYERTLMYKPSVKKQAKGGPATEPPTTTPNIKPVDMSDWEKGGQQDIEEYKKTIPTNESINNSARLYAYKAKLDSALAAKNPNAWKKISGSYDPNASVQDRLTKAQGYIQDKTYPYALNEADQRATLGNDYEDFNKLRTGYAANVAKFGEGKYTVQGSGEQGQPVDQTAYGLRNSWAIGPARHEFGSSINGAPRAHINTTASYDTTKKAYDYQYSQPKYYPLANTKKQGGLLRGYSSKKDPMTKEQTAKQYEADRRRDSSLRKPDMVPGSASKSRSHRS
jgi:hypothetical protein